MRFLSALSMTFALPALLGITACGGDVVAPPETTAVGTAPSIAAPLGTAPAHTAEPPHHTTIIVEAPQPTHEVIIQAPPPPPPHEVTVVVPMPPSVTLTPPSPGSIEIH